MLLLDSVMMRNKFYTMRVNLFAGLCLVSLTACSTDPTPNGSSSREIGKKLFIATDRPESMAFVQKKPPLHDDYLPVGVTPDGHKTAIKNAGQVQAAEQGLDTSRDLSRNFANRAPPAIEPDASLKAALKESQKFASRPTPKSMTTEELLQAKKDSEKFARRPLPQ